MTRLTITYGIDAAGLAVRVEGQTPEQFTRSIPWRVEMFVARAHLSHVGEEALFFNADLGYRDCLTIAECLDRARKYGVEVVRHESFHRFISSEQTFIE